MSKRMLLFTMLAIAVLTTGVCIWVFAHAIHALAVGLVALFLLACGV